MGAFSVSCCCQEPGLQSGTVCRGSFLLRSTLIARSLGGINADACTFVLPVQRGLFTELYAAGGRGGKSAS